MRLLQFIACCALFAVGCGREPHAFPYVLHVDPAFTASERELVGQALDEWRTATGSIVDVVPIESAEDGLNVHRLRAMSMHDPVVRYVERRKNKRITGWVWTADWLGNEQAGDMWIITDRLRAARQGAAWESLFKRTVMHEYGHHLGMRHETSPRIDALMSDGGRGPACITEWDIAQFCSLGYPCVGNEKTTCDD